MLLQDLEKKCLIRPPAWLSDNTQYLALMGSTAYGVSSDESDWDVHGWCIPPKAILFPHLAGEVVGFDEPKKRFEQWQEHHIKDESARREYDFSVYSIVKYFRLCMECNPDKIDSLFTPQTCILHMSQIANMVREHRHSFLSREIWKRYKGYAMSQSHKMREKNPTGKRVAIREKYGFDAKFGLHLVRLLSEAEQLLTECDLDLREKGRREHLKAIRRGEVTEEEIMQWAADKERKLENLYHETKLPIFPDKVKIKQLLLDCLETHYGSLKDCVVEPDAAVRALEEVQAVLDRNRSLLSR